jgi:hypothetical protein
VRRSTTLSAVVLAAGMFLLSGCGSGHSAQTATQGPAIVGVNTRSADGQIAVRDAYVKFAREYAAGSNAPLVLRLFNESGQLATLTGVTTDGGTVVVVSKVAPTTAPPATPSASTSPSASASPNGSRRPNGSASASAASTSAAPTSAAPTTPPALGSPNISIAIPAQSFVVLVPGESDRWLAVDKLSEAVESGGSVTVTLTFTYADGSTTRVTDLRMPVGVPLSPAPRLTPSAGEEH